MEIIKRKSIGAIKAGNKFFPKPFEKTEYYHFGVDETLLPSMFSPWARVIRNMSVRKSDIWILTFPRSGTTWTQEMVWLLSNNIDYKTAENTLLNERFPFFETPVDWDLYNENLETGIEKFDKMSHNTRRFIKTHLPLSLLPKDLINSDAKVINVVRNPIDVVVSWYHFHCYVWQYKGSVDDFVEDFINNYVVYTPYWTFVRQFDNLREKSNFLFLAYEEMQEDITAVIRKVAVFLEKEITAEDVTKLAEHLNFNRMKSNSAINREKQYTEYHKRIGLQDSEQKGTFIRRGKVGSWKDLSPSSLKKLHDWVNQNNVC